MEPEGKELTTDAHGWTRIMEQLTTDDCLLPVPTLNPRHSTLNSFFLSHVLDGEKALFASVPLVCFCGIVENGRSQLGI